MKKLTFISLSALLILFQLTSVFALDIPYKDNESEWLSFCSQSNLSATDDAKCDEFIKYMADMSSGLQGKLDELEKKKDEIAANIRTYTEKIKNFQGEIDSLQVRINEINASITQKETEIKEKQDEIDLKQGEVDKLYETFKQRMITSQSTMRLNTYVDFVMGAKNFDDLIRRSNGIQLITDHDQFVKDTLKGLIAQLEIDKQTLTQLKTELEADRVLVSGLMDDMIVKKKEAEYVKQKYLEEEAKIEEEGNKIAGDLANANSIIKKIIDEIGKIPESNGFTSPISSGDGYLSAGTWYYASGGIHLGADYASYGAVKGAAVRAAGNGVIVSSFDGCGDGYLGASCGNGGTSGGGNQVYLITKIAGSVYGVRYLHLLAGTTIATGSTVSGGDKIGGLGNSGNSSGPHVHVEVIYLGTGDLATYVTNWLASGSLSFGAGFGDAAMNRICANGAGAPCRIRPETLF